MKFLITGAAGFIGFHTASRLAAEGNEVFGIDSFNSYYNVALKRARAEELARKHSCSVVEADCCDYQFLCTLFKKHKIDAVCHLAAQPGVRYSLQNPFAYEENNNKAFLSILEACRNAENKPRLVYASSSSVYGGNTKLPFSENDPVNTPISLYAATKRSNELMAHVYSHLFDLQTIGLRFFTVYGTWGRPDMAVWRFTEAMIQNKPIEVFNSGKMKRDFTFIDDIVSGIISAILNPALAKYEIFNLGNHRAEELLMMINILADALGVKPNLIMKPLQPGDMVETYADIEKAQKKLQFKPETPLTKGLPIFVEWYKKYHNIK
jgi:UDP-glucuronate 4-epimerase